MLDPATPNLSQTWRTGMAIAPVESRSRREPRGEARSRPCGRRAARPRAGCRNVIRSLYTAMLKLGAAGSGHCGRPAAARRPDDRTRERHEHDQARAHQAEGERAVAREPHLREVEDEH